MLRGSWEKHANPAPALPSGRNGNENEKNRPTPMHQTRWSLSLCNQEGEWCDFIDLNEAPHVTLINGNKAYHILSMGCTYSEIDADFFSWQRLVVLFFS